MQRTVCVDGGKGPHPPREGVRRSSRGVVRRTGSGMLPFMKNSRCCAVALVGLVLASGCGELPDPAGEREAAPFDDESNVLLRGVIDCSPRTDVGYRNGEPFEITVVTVDGKPVERNTANAYYVMQQAATAAGVSIRIVSGFRTNAEQEYLYNCYVNCNCNNCNLAARPGYSNHQSGHALDLNTSSAGVLSWLDNHGADYGFKRTVPSEDWHWEWWGGGPGGGPCGEAGGTDRRLVGLLYNAAVGQDELLSGATLRLLKDGQEVGSTTSNDVGFWAFNVAAGDYVITASLAGFQDGTRSASAVDVGDTWATFGLTPSSTMVTGTYRGVVYSGSTPGADPVAGATVTLSNGQAAISTANGAFLFDVPPGEITATACKDGYVSGSVTRTVTANTTVWGSIRIVASSGTAEPLPIPTAVSPVLDEVLDADGIQLSFTRVEHSHHPNLSYELEVHVGGDVAATPVLSLSSQQRAEEVISVGVPPVLGAQRHAWRVRTVDPDGEGAWSTVATFVVRPVQNPSSGTGADTTSSTSGATCSSSNAPTNTSASDQALVSTSRGPADEHRDAGGCAATGLPAEGVPAGLLLLGALARMRHHRKR